MKGYDKSKELQHTAENGTITRIYACKGLWYVAQGLNYYKGLQDINKEGFDTYQEALALFGYLTKD